MDRPRVDDDLESGVAASRVRQALDNAGEVDTRAVQVAVVGGRVVLTGAVPDDEARTTALSIALRVSGEDVEDRLEVGGDPSSPPLDAEIVLPSPDATPPA